MRPPIEHGIFPWWPENGDSWIHPDDVVLARRFIPSDRIFRRERTSGGFYRLRYGSITLRVRPSLWQTLTVEGLEVGDHVEILSRMNRNQPGTATIREMRWNEKTRTICYYLRARGKNLARNYASADLRLLEPLLPVEKLSTVVEPGPNPDDLQLR